MAKISLIGRGSAGFTLVEILAVLLILGIVTVVVVSRWADRRAIDLSSQVEAVKSHLRLAQSRAMSSRSPWGIDFETKTTYYLFQGTGSTNPVRITGEDTDKVSLPARGSALSIESAPLRVTFDQYGSPGESSLTLTTNGGNITITRKTGFIP
jgi:MSHA pilin protein MshC